MSVYTVSNQSAVLGTSSDIETLTLPERLDSDTAPKFEKMILDHIANGSYEIVLDCRNIRFLTAAGLRMILASLRAVKAVEGQLAVRHLHGQAKAMFEACGFDSLIPVLGDHDSVSKSAVAA